MENGALCRYIVYPKTTCKAGDFAKNLCVFVARCTQHFYTGTLKTDNWGDLNFLLNLEEF